MRNWMQLIAEITYDNDGHYGDIQGMHDLIAEIRGMALKALNNEPCPTDVIIKQAEHRTTDNLFSQKRIIYSGSSN